MAKMKKVNAKKLNREGGFDAIPAGKYPAMVVKSEVKKSKKNKHNEYLELIFKVLKGKYKGRQIWGRFNLWNDNETAVEIAEREFALLCDAVGLGNATITDSKKLHEKPLLLKVKVKPASGGYDESNEPAGFEPLGNGKDKGKGKKGKNKKPW